MGRTILSAVIASICLLPSLGEAQTSRGAPATMPGIPRGGSSGVTIRHDPPPPGQPAPAPPPGVPLVPPAPPSALDRVDLFQASPRTYAPRYNRAPRQRFRGNGSGYGYITDPFGYVSQPYPPQGDDSQVREAEGTGYLRLDVEPDAARVYVDGLYVGTVGDFRRSGRALDAGPHRVEIRADGFEVQSFDVRIRANDMLSYRGTLARTEQRVELRAPVPKTFYVIPGCYAGDVRPRTDKLPKGCQVARLREIPPVVDNVRK